MKYLRISAFVAFLIILSSCSTFSLLKDRPKGLSSPHRLQSANTAYNPSKSYIDLLEERSRVLLPVVAFLLFILLMQRICRSRQGQKKRLDLNDGDLALVGLIYDSASDLLLRIQGKKKKKVIPFLKSTK